VQRFRRDSLIGTDSTGMLVSIHATNVLDGVCLFDTVRW
jgi:hypothetical protein